MTTQTARLIRKTRLSADTSDFAFQLASGTFAGLEPGAHIDIHLGQGLMRQYSIWDWSEDHRQLHVAVKREDNGRGGSRAMHDLAEGTDLQVGQPRNHFKLQDDDRYVTLIAGGIGATPLVAMARALATSGREFGIHYLTRSMDLAAMDGAFRELNLGARYHLHCDDTDGPLDLAALLESIPADSDVYTCGPEPMLTALLDASSALRGGKIHFERFAAATNADNTTTNGFEIEISSTGAVLPVGPDETIVDVLKANAIDIDVGCAEGLCGACMVDVLDGEVDHRDGILSSDEQASNSYLCTCVSRAKSPRLVLNL
ncbi:PDR/VanB family oxidoreductase [Phaeobacter sp.]|uniref:PDR/VanB family oxidoreductase n=1 Tax=Phaeobacter sp. TaxID=1902409 RepID=UPI0025F796A9|nr:PDR/VanB family oxidoreductase [Phaeobacter sp.]